MAVSKRPAVLIVGAGPVGLALAGDLGWRGVECLLIEKGSGEIYQPRMDLVGIRTMEFCRRWGIVDWVEASPYPRDLRQDCLWVSSITGWEFGREPFPTLDEEPIPPESPQKRERCPQDMFDPILARFVRSQKSASIRYHCELVSLRRTRPACARAFAMRRPALRRRSKQIISWAATAPPARSASSSALA